MLRYIEKAKPCHAGIHLKAILEYYQMNTNKPGFQTFCCYFTSFYFEKIATCSNRINIIYWPVRYVL